MCLLLGAGDELSTVYRKTKEKMVQLRDNPIVQTNREIAKTWTKLYKSYTRRQKDDVIRRGFTFLEPYQLKILYGPGSVYNSSETDFDLEEYERMSKKDRQLALEDEFRYLAGYERDTSLKSWSRRLKEIAESEMDGNTTTLRPHRETTLSPVVLNPDILNPAVLGPLTFSSKKMVGDGVLNPAALSPTSLTARVGDPQIISPYVYAPNTLSASLFRPELLNPHVLSPETVNPNAFSPTILKPIVLSPATLNPHTLSPNILSPRAVSPMIMSPGAFSPSILSPGILSRKRRKRHIRFYL